MGDAAEAARVNRAHKLSAIFARMEAPDRPRREAAFEDLLKFLPANDNVESDGHPSASFLTQNTDEANLVRGALIRLLITENNPRRVQPSGLAKPTTETQESDANAEGSEDEYYPELIGIVADFDDERAIPALVGAIATGGMAERGLLKYGEKALGPVLNQLNSPDPLMRSEALSMSVTLLLRQNDAPSHAKILALIGSALQDQEFVSRMAAIQNIERLDDADRVSFVPRLKELAEHDPVILPGKPDDGGDGGKFYPLRQNARRSLRMIANHERPQVDKGLSSDQVSPH